MKKRIISLLVLWVLLYLLVSFVNLTFYPNVWNSIDRLFFGAVSILNYIFHRYFWEV